MSREPKPIRWKTLLVLLALALGLGSLYRFTDLAKKPMHTDEAILAMKTQEFWESGTFEYDPHDYHGPLLHHLTKWVGELRGWSAATLDEEQVRWVVAVCGLLLVLTPLLLVDVLGRTGAGLASLLIGVSPMMTYYSRYYIMEMPFVLLVAIFIASLWRWTQKRNPLWLVLAGILLGLMHATKETFVLNMAALTAGWGVVRLMGLSFTPKQSSLGFGSFARKPAVPWLPGVVVLCVAAAASIWLFSNGFKTWDDVRESVATYESYLGRSAGAGGHEKPWHYYVTLLFWRQQGFLWSEALIGGLAVVGMLNAFSDHHRADHKRAFLVCFATYAIVLLVIYCIIPYKTPWTILAVDHAFALLAGLGARTIFRAFGEMPVVKAGISLLLAGGVYNLCRQTSLATDYNFPHETRYAASEIHNPYVYSHTAPNLVQLAARIHELAQKHPAGKQMPVQVIQSEQGWPLPWYLRDMNHVGYQAEIPAALNAPVVIVDGDKEEAVQTKLGGGYESSIWGLRPGLAVSLLIEKSLIAPPVADAPALATTTPPAATPPATVVTPDPVPAPVSTPPPATPPAPPVPSGTATMVPPKAELVLDEPEQAGPPYPVPAPPTPAPPVR